MELPIPELTRSVDTRSYRGNKRAILKKRKEIQKELSAMKSINSRDLVDYYRGVGGLVQGSTKTPSCLRPGLSKSSIALYWGSRHGSSEGRAFAVRSRSDG